MLAPLFGNLTRAEQAEHRRRRRVGAKIVLAAYRRDQPDR
jgi:hypothetical protein